MPSTLILVFFIVIPRITVVSWIRAVSRSDGGPVHRHDDNAAMKCQQRLCQLDHPLCEGLIDTTASDTDSQKTIPYQCDE